jgi:membrane peptidoglycan carboxypeptidase
LTLDDHVNGLATDARLGVAIPRTFILKITDASGKTVYNWTQPKGTQVVRQDAAYIVDNMASDPRASYLPGSCTATSCTSLAQGGQKFQRFQGWDFAVKTGTTNNSFDGLMTSWSTQYAVVSWVGSYTRNIALVTPGFEYQTEPLTRGLMQYIHNGIKPINWVQPSDIKTLPSFVVRNHIHYGDEEPSPTDDIYPSWYVGGSSGKTTSETIDKVSDAVATSCTPADAKEVVSNGNVASWNVDIFNGGTPNIGTGIKSTASGSSVTDDVHNCNDSPPTVTLTAPGSCNGSCTITATVTQGTHPLSDPQYPQFPGMVVITLDGTQIYTSDVSNSPSTVSFNYKPTSSGSGTVKATVTDSVLYQGTATSAMTYSAASPITATVGATGANATVSWTGGNGTFIVTDNGAATSCTTSGCSIALTAGSNAIVVQDSDGDTSNTVTVSGT